MLLSVDLKEFFNVFHLFSRSAVLGSTRNSLLLKCKDNVWGFFNFDDNTFFSVVSTVFNSMEDGCCCYKNYIKK